MKTKILLLLIAVLLFHSCNQGNDSSGPVFPREYILFETDDYFPYSSIHSLDYDQDNDQDILLSTSVNLPMLWYENDGLGNFTLNTLGEDTYYIGEATFIDMNGDGDMDFIDIYKMFSSYHFEYNENNGSNQYESIDLQENDSYRPDDFDISDINGDGLLDIVLIDDIENKLLWMDQDRDGEFHNYNYISSDFSGGSLVLGVDLNEDDRMDLLSTEFADPTQDNPETNCDIIWWEQRSEGSFTKNVIEEAVNCLRILTEELNGLPNKELVIQNNQDLLVYSYDGEGVFSSQTIFTSYAFKEIFFYDVESDGDMDIICYIVTEEDLNDNGRNDRKVILLTNDGSANFSSFLLLDGLEVENLHVCDLNSDNRVDFFITNLSDPENRLVKWIQIW